MNASAVIKAIYDCEVNCRIEWFWDAGFTWSVLDGKMYPRVAIDDDTDGAMEVVYESVDSMLIRSQPLPEKDWSRRGGHEDFDTTVREMAEAVMEVYPLCRETLEQLLK